MDMWIEITGWIGMALIVLGRGAIAYKARWGFLIAVVGGLIVGAQAVLMSNLAIVILCGILACLDLKGWHYWGKKDGLH